MEVHGGSGVLQFGAQPHDVDRRVGVGRTLVGVVCVAREAVDFLLRAWTSPPHLRGTLLGAP